MSDSTTAPTTATETQTSTPQPAATPPAQPAAAPAATPPAQSEQEPTWLPARLERERKAILRDLGVENVDNAKAALKAYREQQEAAKTEQQRTAERLAALELQAKRAADLEAVLNARSESEFASLSDAQRSAVEAIAGTDPAARLRAIDALRPTWAAANATAPKAPIAAPASTAPANPAPPPTAPADENVLATYERIKAENPMAAANYRLRNSAAFLRPKTNASG